MDVPIIKLSIPRCPVGPNGTRMQGKRIQGLLQMHWAERRKYFHDWFLEIFVAARGYYPKREHRCRVAIEIMRPRLLDPDNATASVKPILDGLRKCGIIHQDSPKWLDLEVRQTTHFEERTIITVWELQ